MIAFPINKVPTLFIQAFTADDVSTILEYVREASSLNTSRTDTVLFIDTPPTPMIVEAAQKLKLEGYRVVFRDHHGFSGQPMNERDRQRSTASAKLEQLLGEDCRITVRSLHPACSTLVEVGEFKDALAIIADPDADGLTGAMKAAGITYDGLDEDAAKLDSEPAMQVTGTPISQLLAKGVVVLPSYDSSKPTQREQAQQKLFRDWVAAVQGDEKAHARLETGVVAYDQAVAIARQLAPRAIEVAPGVLLVDVCNSPIYDAGTLTSLMEACSGCSVTVLRKDKGPIAALHGVQYSLAVAKTKQDTTNLKTLLPSHFKNDPQLGSISNVSFLLHVSEEVWNKHVLPALQSSRWNP
jgi:hypothetical protein